MREECYAPVREIFAGAMLSNTDFAKLCGEYGCTEQNPALRPRLGFALRQAVYFNPEFSETVLQRTICACNERLFGHVKEDV